jgi:hypothetical protein
MAKLLCACMRESDERGWWQSAVMETEEGNTTAGLVI